MKINYSEVAFTGYRVRLYDKIKKVSNVYPESGKPYYATAVDAMAVASACFNRNPSKFSSVTFEIVYEEHGQPKPIPAI